MVVIGGTKRATLWHTPFLTHPTIRQNAGHTIGSSFSGLQVFFVSSSKKLAPHLNTLQTFSLTL